MLTIKILTTSNNRQKMSHHRIHLDHHHGKDMMIIFIVFTIIIMTNSCINASAVGWEKFGQGGGSSSSICNLTTCPFILPCSCVAASAAHSQACDGGGADD
jgi:hypothetical protein